MWRDGSRPTRSALEVVAAAGVLGACTPALESEKEPRLGVAGSTWEEKRRSEILPTGGVRSYILTQMGLTLVQLEELREEAMAEDIDITAMMFGWDEERARLFFENGGEEEHEVTSWLRSIALLAIEASLRTQIDSLDQLKKRVEVSIASTADEPHAILMGIDIAIASLKVGQLTLVEKATLRNALKELCGHGAL